MLNKNTNRRIFKNIKRKNSIMSGVRYFKKTPLPSQIEISLFDTCNRSCSFCPKSNSNIAPNTNNKISISLIDKFVKDLISIKFDGIIHLCGYGEPLLHKKILEICKKLSEASTVEITTNGDVLNHKLLNKLYLSGVSKILLSLYDGIWQVKKFKDMIKKSKVPNDFVILRDRWYSKEGNFGVKLTNRAGTVKVGNQIPNNVHTVCYYPAYQFMMEWDGNVFLCPQDWQRKESMGNLNYQSVFEIWNGKKFKRFRKNLINGHREDKPCLDCNAQGTIYGESHYHAWREKKL